ncbi:TetR family transcriptional regulator [Bacillus sp. 1P06AnD]|uniref:TetR/AcrR family transcriptional regulator n=1 Tax=Bacillus sp. 1P06AnD TaxID=3132208 RepID=UPI00399F5EE4
MQARIMNAFIEEIQAKGMKFTMDDLAKRLGISKRTLYEHFSSKIQILDGIIEHTIAEFDEQTERILEDDSLNLLEKIKKVITVVPKYNEFYDLRILEQMKRYYPVQYERMHTALNQWDALRGLIEKGIEEGLIVNRNVPLMMKLILDATNSTLDRSFFIENSINLNDALAAIVDILLFGLIDQHHPIALAAEQKKEA